MKSSNTTIETLVSTFPQYNVEQLKALRSVWYQISGRCGKRKGYEDVENEFTLESFIQHIADEANKGRDWFQIEQPCVCRIFDSGNYNAQNTQIKSRAENTREARAVTLKIHDPMNDTTILYPHGIRNLYRANKDRLSISLSKFYLDITNKRPILLSHDGQSAHYKIEIV
ncbi:TPA: hypothetical protein ACMDQP_003100 [Vibrio cholerae]